MRPAFTATLSCLVTCAYTWAGTIAVERPASDDAPRVSGPPTRYMGDFRRKEQAWKTPADKPENAVPQEKVTKETYLAWCERSGHLERDLRNRKHQQYGPRHALPSLAKYVASGEKKYGESVREMLRNYHLWLQEEVKRRGHNGRYMFDPTCIGIELLHLRKGGLIRTEDEVWIREMILLLNRTVHVWGNECSFWRGSMHRAQGEGVMKWLAAQWYPDAPEAGTWRAYAKLVWNDFWEYRDNPANDINYYSGTVFPILLGAELMERTPSGQTAEEFFKDPEMVKIWDRLAYAVSPDGAVTPYGPHYGWNSHPGQRIWMLELAARYTRDGRYRFVAHRMMNYLNYQERAFRAQHMLDGPMTTEQLALAYLLTDDSIKPVEPEPGSRILYHKETLRVNGKKGAAAYLKNLDPASDKAHICCNLIVTGKEMPFKLVFRSGWGLGDLFMFVDLFPRHEPMNVTGILGLTRHGTVLTMSRMSKDISDLQNLTVVEDLSGTATPVINPNPNTVDAYYQTVTVDAFSDHKLATHAVVRVKDYLGFSMTHHREFFFIKNRFVVLKDLSVFRESFLARIGPVWKTQNIDAVGSHWANTYLTCPVAGPDIAMKHNPYDLLVYYAPQKGARVTIDGDGATKNYNFAPYRVRYEKQLIVKAGDPLHCTTLLLPHNPRTAAKKLAESIRVHLDTPKQTVMCIAAEKERQEWIVLNPTGADLKTMELETDAKQVYLDVVKGKVARVLTLGGRRLSLGKEEVVRQEERGDVERPGD